MKYQLSEELINSILAYLGSKPFQEVFQMINKIHMEVKEQQEINKQEK